MAVVLTSASKPRPGSCNHRVAEVTIDGSTTVNVDITLAELNDSISADDVRTVLRLWARYQTSKGVALTTLVGKTIFADIP